MLETVDLTKFAVSCEFNSNSKYCLDVHVAQFSFRLGLLNLYHAMEGEDHTLLVFVKHQEMALYHKAWPNHVIVGLPTSADNQGIGAARYYIKVFNTSL